MEPNRPPSTMSYLAAAVFLAVVGWGGLVVLILKTTPTIIPRWLFFFFLVIALSGTALPVMAFLNRRFPSAPPATQSVIIRQSTWIGIFGAALAWLQLGRVLTTTLILLLLLGLALIEFLLRLSEQSQWKP